LVVYRCFGQAMFRRRILLMQQQASGTSVLANSSIQVLHAALSISLRQACTVKQTTKKTKQVRSKTINAKHKEDNPSTKVDQKPIAEVCPAVKPKRKRSTSLQTSESKCAEDSPASKNRRQFGKDSIEWNKHDLFRHAFDMVNADGSWKLHPSLDSNDLPDLKPRELDVLHIIYFRLEDGG
jgi:hypothetical protein